MDFIKNPQTTIALTFMTHIISGIDVVWCDGNMDKGLTVPKWVIRVPPKIPQMPQNVSAQFV